MLTNQRATLDPQQDQFATLALGSLYLERYAENWAYLVADIHSKYSGTVSFFLILRKLRESNCLYSSNNVVVYATLFTIQHERNACEWHYIKTSPIKA